MWRWEIIKTLICTSKYIGVRGVIFLPKIETSITTCHMISDIFEKWQRASFTFYVLFFNMVEFPTLDCSNKKIHVVTNVPIQQLISQNNLYSSNDYLYSLKLGLSDWGLFKYKLTINWGWQTPLPLLLPYLYFCWSPSPPYLRVINFAWSLVVHKKHKRIKWLDILKYIYYAML